MYKVKFEVVELEMGDYHTLVQGRIAGHRVRIVLDTGASHSCVDMQFAAEKLQLNGNLFAGIMAGIGSGDFDIHVTAIRDFKLGHFKLDEYENIALVDFSHINVAYQEFGKKPIQMILGNDFFVNHHAIIDYNSKELLFFK